MMGLRRFLLAVLRAARNVPAALRVIARSRRTVSPVDWFHGLSDETWFWLNTTGRRHSKTIADLLPAIPAAATQELFTGSSGDATLGEGFNAYRVFKRSYEKHIGPLSTCRSVLDFGCGWGRIIRFFLRDVQATRLLGIDPSEEIIRACRDTNRWCRFIQIDPHAPTSLPEASFNLIYLYSVFSHLPEGMHLAWLREFHRVLAPGGMLIATTRGRDFIQLCKTLREDPGIDGRPGWLKGSARIFADFDATMAAYDRGQFCYEGYGMEDRWGYWGEACIPRGYVEKRWSQLFDICEYIEDRKLCPQNVIVVRKRGSD